MMDLLGDFLKGKKAAVDSRKLLPGDIFFCLKGERSDGHDYLREVKAKGAVAAVVSKNYSGQVPDLPLYRVDDPLKTLQEIAGKIQSQRKARLIGITGSVGKTTTKEFVHQLISYKYRCGKSPGNSNSQVGIPLAILNALKSDDEIAVLEMGMNHSGEISQLVQIAPPELAVITAVEYVHAAHFDSLEAIARAKGEILSHPSTKMAVLGPSASRFKWGYIRCSQAYPEKVVGLQSELPPHFKENLACAQEVVRYLGFSEEEIALATQAIKPPDNRFQIMMKSGICIVNDSYNASEPSVLAALRSLPDPPGRGGRIFAVLGEMLELGAFSQGCHERVAEAAVKKVDQLFIVGEGCFPLRDRFEKAGKPVVSFDAKGDFIQEMAHELKERVKPGDCVLLKGSRFWQLDRLVEVF